MANIITACRVVCSILLLFFPLFSSGFYVTYLLCGFSDMIDGTVQEKQTARTVRAQNSIASPTLFL